jgi:hypothetical protein
MKLEPNPAVKAALEIAWVTAARGGDLRALQTGNVEVSEKDTKVRFRAGKTASAQAYTIMTTLVSNETKSYIRERNKRGLAQWIFPQVSGEDLKLALRRANPLLEQRSIRRGALQHLAVEGKLTDEQLLHYSQHRSIQTLKRYLAFGWLSGEQEGRAVGAKELKLI